MPFRACNWHKCSKTFEPEDPRQKYCCHACLKRRSAWKAARGGPLVDMLLNNDANGLIEAKRKMIQEIKRDTPCNSQRS